MDWNSQDPMNNFGGTLYVPATDGGGIYTLEEASQFDDADRETRLDVPIRPYNHREGPWGEAIRQPAPATPYGRFNADMRTPGYPPKQAGYPHREYFAGAPAGEMPDRITLAGMQRTPYFHNSRRGQEDIFAMSSPERPSRADPGTAPDSSLLAYPEWAHSGQRPSGRRPWPIIPVYHRDDYMGINGTGGDGGLPRPGGCAGTGAAAADAAAAAAAATGSPPEKFGGGAPDAAGGSAPIPIKIFQMILIIILLIIVAMLAHMIRMLRKTNRRLKKACHLTKSCLARLPEATPAASAH